MKNTIRISLLALALTTAFSVSPFADEGQQKHPLHVTADKVREGQTIKERTAKQIAQLKAQISAKKEIIGQREKLVSKLDSDQKAENKLASRDQGAGAAARQAHEVRKQDRYRRRQEQTGELQKESQQLARLQQELKNQEAYYKNVDAQQERYMKTLKAQAEQYRYQAFCQANMGHAYKPAGSGFGAFVGRIGMSEAEKVEAGIQQVLADANCPPASAVSERRAPRERVLERQVAQQGSEAAVPRAIPVAEAGEAQEPAPRQAGNFQDPYSASSAR